MADETTILELIGAKKGRIIKYKCADAVAIPKGTICKFSNLANVDRAVAPSSAGTDNFAGIAVTEKVANDGQVEIGLATHGIFRIRASATASITAGDKLFIDGANRVKEMVVATHFRRALVGIALDDMGANAWGQVLVGCL